ncbi:MAG TPA: HIT family protein [Longimicrobium sp.]|nr:HIT family protein [Longimicrobium sp.]
MSRWTDPAAWAQAISPEHCTVCVRGVPDDALAVLGSCWVGMPEDGPMRGYCFLMLHEHAVELHDVSPDVAAAFMRDAQAVSAAVQRLTGAVKMNYEIHGNTVPHLHMHVFPRYVGDPFEGAPINPRAIRHAVYAPGEYAVMRRALGEALARPSA